MTMIACMAAAAWQRMPQPCSHACKGDVRTERELRKTGLGFKGHSTSCSLHKIAERCEACAHNLRLAPAANAHALVEQRSVLPCRRHGLVYPQDCLRTAERDIPHRLSLVYGHPFARVFPCWQVPAMCPPNFMLHHNHLPAELLSNSAKEIKWNRKGCSWIFDASHTSAEKTARKLHA